MSRKAHKEKARHHRVAKKEREQVTGRVQMTREGFIFVIVDGRDEDIFVKASKTRNALNGDTVRVSVTKEAKKGQRCEGEVIDIIERSKKPFVGVLHFAGGGAWVLMQSKNMPYDIEVDAKAALDSGGKSGQKVSVIVDYWSRKDSNPVGHIVDILGEPGLNDTEMHAILAEFDLPYRFSEEVESAADSISEKIGREQLKGREDFRKTFTFTIDPADAKDFDDALSFKRLDNGNYEVGVHIADVSHYVRPGTPVDREARERGTSVYLVDRTVPMLPEKLCNKLCSLRPGEDKLTFSTVFEITPDAVVKDFRICRTVINSNERLDYDQAQKIIEDGAADTELNRAILTLNGFAAKFKERRFKKGAINFERPEMKVEVDAEGRPVRIYQKVSKEANFLIEEFMLLANRTVAEFIASDAKMNGAASSRAKAFVYRIHDEPNLVKLSVLRSFAASYGYKTEEMDSGKAASREIRKLLSSSKGKPENAAIENIALRAMAKAVYSTDNIGHYGLAFKFYTHFTSPIRRYPDTLVHRLLGAYLGGGDSWNREALEKECVHASEREGVAADAERTSIKYKLVEYMQDKVGQVFDGTVSGMTEWGMYVEIEPTKIEGMVPLREIRSDFYEFDEQRYRLVGRRTRKKIRLGDPVRIRVKNANLEQRLLDFELIEKETVNESQNV